jgi:succinylglutamate desuccinylase
MSQQGATIAPATTERDHVIARFRDDGDGPTLIVVGSIHGNERGGSDALRNVAQQIRRDDIELAGRVFLIEGNVRALSSGVRFIDSDLNRHWTQANIEGVGRDRAEDIELAELLGVFREILGTAKDEVYVLDLHSTSADGLPFATLGDTLRNRHFAQQFPVTVLLGIEEQLEGTMLEYLNNLGAVTLGFEGGQHVSDRTIANHEALVWLAMVNAGIARAADIPDIARSRRDLERQTRPERIIEVRYRHAIEPADEFVMNPGFNNFDRVTAGQVLAKDRRGPVLSPETGLLLMPLYQKKGEDGFFIGRKVAPFWIRLSEVLRNLKLANLMHMLPGVRRHPTDAESLIVNTTVARFFPLQIFHLLGFRRRVWRNHALVVSRRKFDTRSPFVA